MSEHEIFAFNSQSARLAFSGGELKVKESDSSSGYSVRVLEGGKIGFGFCQHENELKGTLEEAKKLSRFSVKSDFAFAPKSTYTMPDIVDPLFENPDFDMLKSYSEDIRSAIESKGGKARIILSIDNSDTKIENTSGFLGNYKKTVFSMYAECMHGDGYGYSYFTSHHIPPDLNEIGTKAAEMAVSMQSATKPETGSYTIVMEPESIDSLIETILPSFSGDWKRRKITKLLNSSRFDERLSISEDGLSNGISSRPFDDEGTPSKRRFLIEKGEVKSFLYDRETAALEGVEESGACTKATYDSSPSIGSSNIVIQPGDFKDLGEIERYIEVHYAHGSHTANITSGDIGLEVSAAFLVEKGKRKPIKGFLISSNVFDLFRNIEAIESSQRVYGSLVTPRIAFKDIKIVA